MAEITIVPDDVLDRLLAARPQHVESVEAWDSFQRAVGCYEPTRELLRRTIDAVFWASVQEEEGKPTLVPVLFADVRDPCCRLEPRNISAHALCKLSPLVDVASNALLVSGEGNIVGVGQRDKGEVGVVPNHPGRLTVFDSGTVLGVFERGNWQIIGSNSIEIACLLQEALPSKTRAERLERATVIVALVEESRRARRGAILVLIADDCREGIGPVVYPVEQFPALVNSLATSRGATASTPSSPEQKQLSELVRGAISIAAAGSGIDGATLIDSLDLRVLGFGAKIVAPDASFEVKVVEWPTKTARLVDKSHVGGMRHQSAARLVYRNHSAAVITVSQDGPVSLFSWDNGNVRMDAHLDRYLR